ncbi:MAG: ABC transporter ATP-binding protein [Verrucomicrobia bacterium]|nr:ABC transporter ATP-binding protein [Verrucomicrobiota bacterium]MBV8485728.1 ABC transporter ATP-binding protein [Verrucomicrobiota bacterium]
MWAHSETLRSPSFAANQQPKGNGHDAKIPKNLLGFVWPYAARHRRLLLFAFALNCLPGVAIAFQTLAPKYLIDDVLTPKGLPANERIVRLTILLSLYLVAAFVLRMAAWYASYRIFTRIREHVVLDLRARFFEHINGLCLRFHNRHSSGELFTNVMGSPLQEIAKFFHSAVINVPNAATMVVVACAWIFFWDWSLTAVLVTLVIATALTARYSSLQLRSLFQGYQAAESRIIGRVVDIFRGNRDIKMHGIEPQINSAFKENVDCLREKAYERDVGTHRVNMRAEGLGYICFALLCGLGAWRYFTGHITSGQLMGFLAAYLSLYQPLTVLFTVGTMHGQAEASFTRLQKVLRAQSSTPEPVPALRLNPPTKADIVLREVSFAYNPGTTVLRDITLSIPFGQRVAFVGPSGSGKSTLAKLLLRLYDPESGSISFGDVDLRNCSPRDVCRHFGVVPQDPYFFATTIRDNLTLIDRHCSNERLLEVCESANAWEFIRALPHGLNTLVGEGGVRLSGGQRQRLAIARALLHNPDYLLFDEATSALDTVSERLVKQALSRILVGRTAILIAHRLSTIKHCDRILVIADGEIVQDGTFQELSLTPGLFKDMVDSDKFDIGPPNPNFHAPNGVALHRETKDQSIANDLKSVEHQASGKTSQFNGKRNGSV